MARVAVGEVAVQKLLDSGRPKHAADRRAQADADIESRLLRLDHFVFSTALTLHADPVDLYLALTRFCDALYSMWLHTCPCV